MAEIVLDLRNFIQRCEEIGELKVINGAHWDLEIGTLTFEVGASTANPPALLFDRIEGYPAGFRVLTMPASTDRRVALALGLSDDASRLEIVQELKQKFKEPMDLIPPVEVKDGPIFENEDRGDDIDLLKFPVPRWTARDGGRYIGSGDTVIAKDPDEGWVNVSTHRIQVLDKSRCVMFIESGQQLNIIREKYWKKGQNCPMAVTIGTHPLIVSVGGTKLPWGMCEYDYAGWWMKAPVEVVKGPTTGLPIPAHSEIVLEGEMTPRDVESVKEGPFAEFTGHYSPGGNEAVFQVQRVLYRNDPIILGLMPYLGPGVPTWTRSQTMSAEIWNKLDEIVPGVTGVWLYEDFGKERCLAISLKQQFPGHAKQAALAALGHYTINRKYIVVVDDDVDPSNLREVLFAMGNRADPETFDLIRGNRASKLDPLSANPERQRTGNFTLSTLIILACKPFEWIDKFPPAITFDKDLRGKVREKWKGFMESL